MKEPMTDSNTCTLLAGVGEKTAEKLAKLNIYSIPDLLLHLPVKYQDRTQVSPIRHLISGMHAVVEGEIETVQSPKIGRTRFLCQLRDRTGFIHLRFFSIHPMQIKKLKEGVTLRCFGEVRFSTLGFEMVHPEYKIIEKNSPPEPETHLTPIYPSTEGVSQFLWRKLTEEALRWLNQIGKIGPELPDSILKKLKFPQLNEALHHIHMPPIGSSLEALLAYQHPAQKRLIFDELLAHRLSLLYLKNHFQSQQAIQIIQKTELTTQFIQQLPYELTASQKKVIEEVNHDLAQNHPMIRLVQGDVGCGKTVVAALTMLQVVAQGYQAALMVPTELLAEQHYHQFTQWFKYLGIQPLLLFGGMTKTQKNTALSAIQEGQAVIVIGTHAVFQKDVIFKQLVLVVVDEQHRFGVQQRAQLREKGFFQQYCPHQLIMTATPIPRTLAMSVYADLDYSVIDELPPGRTPIVTRVVPNTRREEVLFHIRDACLQGKQAYWVCTLIEESEMLACQAAEKTYAWLQEALPDICIGLLHGRVKGAEKERMMKAFKNKEIHLLVATTVIEVGVDVPNASLMVIENAERLGLSQLHQLRGRVGRGALESCCLLLYQAPLSMLAKARLAVMRETTDGFKIAQKDLELRGPGEVLGTKQTGEMGLRIADLVRDKDLLPAVHEAASFLQKNNPDWVAELIQRWIGENVRYKQV